MLKLLSLSTYIGAGEYAALPCVTQALQELGGGRLTRGEVNQHHARVLWCTCAHAGCPLQLNASIAVVATNGRAWSGGAPPTCFRSRAAVARPRPDAAPVTSATTEPTCIQSHRLLPVQQQMDQPDTPP
jgi:hypothetical protein